jgi:hypothetical protein
MISTNLQAKYAREDFEHSKASKRRKRVEFISYGSCVMELTRGHTRKHGKGKMSHEQILYFANKSEFSWGKGPGERAKCDELIKAGLLVKLKRPKEWSRRDGELYRITDEGRAALKKLKSSQGATNEQ